MSGGTWLVTGGTGLLGAAVVAQARAQGIHVVATHHGQDAPSLDGVQWHRVNLVEEGSVEALMAAVAPSVVIHTAAVAQPLDCEKNPALATSLNALVPARLGRLAARSGARLIHVSTDLVFDGRNGPYAEDAAPCPISHYGKTKLLAEEAITAAGGSHVIARTSLILGPSPAGNRGVEELLFAAFQRGESPKLFVDEFRSPTAAVDLAAVLVALGTHPFCGVLNVAGQEAVSRHSLGSLVGHAFGFPLRQITAASLASSPVMTPPRAPHTVLDTRRLRTMEPALPGMRSLAHILAQHPLAGRLRGVAAG